MNNDVLERACEVYRDVEISYSKRLHQDLGHHPQRECPRPDPYGNPCDKCFSPHFDRWPDMPEPDPERERIRELLRPVVAVLVPGQTRGFVTLQADVLDEMVGTAIQREREECRRIAKSYAEEAERQAEHESDRVFNGTGSWAHGDRRHNDGRRDVAEQIERRIRERSRA